MVFLVVVLHSGLVYESSGFAGIFWIVYDFDTNILVDELNMIIDIFVMSVIFFISGYLTLPSLQKKGKWNFVKTKAKRLLIPWLFGVFVMIPLYKVIFLMSRGMPQENWTTYFHFSNGIISQNWLWYLPILFIFDMIFMTFSKIKINPEKISLKIIIPGMFVVAFGYSLSMYLLGLQGWTKNSIVNFQNERLLIYFMMFLFGNLCFSKKIFHQMKPKYNIVLILIALVGIFAYRYFYMATRFNPGTLIVSEWFHRIGYWLSFEISLFGLVYLFIVGFWKFFNQQPKIGKVMNQNSYYVYIIHTVIMGCIGYLLLEVNLPSVLKFFILTTFTYLLSNLLVSFHRSITQRFKLLILK